MEGFQILAGFGLLVLGGEGLVRGSVAIAHRLRLSTLLVSMVIVGFGTSTPELMVSATAAVKGFPNIALGNVVGSNIANVLLILGLAAMLAPIPCSRPEITRDALAVLVASIALLGLALHGEVGRLTGLVMLAALAAYLSYAYLTDRRTAEPDDGADRQQGPNATDPPLFKSIAFCVLGILLLLGGAHLLVEGATALATRFGVSNAVIGLSLVAVGTSLPELATALVAAYRKHADVVIGNVLGSNLFNVLGILGLTGIIAPIPFEGRIAEIDIWIMVAVAIALAPMIWTGRKISRVEGSVFLGLYAVYVVWLYAGSSP